MTNLKDYFKNIEYERNVENRKQLCENNLSNQDDSININSTHKEKEYLQERESTLGGFVASKNRHKFHSRNCKWAVYILNSPNMVEFPSYKEAIEAGYKPCRTCSINTYKIIKAVNS